MLRSYQTCLLLIKKIPAENPCHLWGGKRVAEAWDPQSGVLSVLLDGPEGVEETIVLATGHRPFRQVSVDGTPATFYYDAQQRLAYGKIVFKKDPVRLEVLPVDHDGTGIPEGPLEPDELHRYYEMP